MNLAQIWRYALCDAALTHGPTAPTLCEGWDVRDLLAHLVVRDTRPDALLAMAVPAAAGYEERLRSRATEAAFEALVTEVRSGPPRLSPLSVSALDAAVNTVEFLIHHEDIVRAAADTEDPAARPGREIDQPTSDAAWKAVARTGRLLYRAAPVGVVVVAPGVGRAALRRPPKQAGSVVLTGQPVELLLHAFGRTEAAVVKVHGDRADVAAFGQGASDDSVN